MRKDLILRYANGALQNLTRLERQIDLHLYDSSVSDKVHGTSFSKGTISSTDARFLADLLNEIAEKALSLSEEFEFSDTEIV